MNVTLQFFKPFYSLMMIRSTKSVCYFLKELFVAIKFKMATNTKLQYLAILICFTLHNSNGQECKPLDSVKSDELSVIYSERSGGLASQLLVYAMLRQLRQDFYLNAYMSRHCYDTLSQVFTEKSIQDVPIFEDTFCKSPTELSPEVYSKPISEILTNKELHRGRFLWLFPSNKVLKLNENTERPYSEYR